MESSGCHKILHSNGYCWHNYILKYMSVKELCKWWEWRWCTYTSCAVWWKNWANCAEESTANRLLCVVPADQIDNYTDGHGRIQQLKSAFMYCVKRRCPLVIHGPPGGGRTSIIAAISQFCRSWLSSPHAVVASRVIASSPASMTIEYVLSTICYQISEVGPSVHYSRRTLYVYCATKHVFSVYWHTLVRQTGICQTFMLFLNISVAKVTYAYVTFVVFGFWSCSLLLPSASTYS